MKRLTLAAAVAVTFLLAAGVRPAAAQPQFQSPSLNQPAVSPYLNLLRGGSSPAINYYGLVRPQIEFRNSYQRLQQDVMAEQQQQPEFGPGDVTGLPPTGHFAQFNTQGRYFMTRGALGSSGGGPAGATPLRQQATAPPRGRPATARPPGT